MLRIQKTFSVPKCLGDLWDGPTKFKIQTVILREANVTIQEFDTAWMKTRSSLTTKRAKMQLVQLLKDAGIGDCSGASMKAQRQRRVWFVNEVVGRGTGAPPPAVIPDYTRTHVRLF